MNNDFENILKESLKPVYRPDDKLNERIINGKRNKAKTSILKSTLPKVAAAAAAVMILGAGSYAAVKYYNVIVDEHSITTGQTLETISDERYQEIIKDQEVAPGYETSTQYYDDITEPLSRFSSTIRFTKSYELIGNAEYSVTTGPQDYESRSFAAFFRYNDGDFNLNISKLKNDESLLSSSILLESTENEREYVRPDGLSLTLVDEVRSDGTTRTYVKFPFKNPNGEIFFEDLDDNEIREILDSIEFVNPEVFEE